MQIEYTTMKKEYPKLSEIPSGTVFSPTNSLEIYLKLDKDGLSDVFCDSYNILKRNTLNLQNLDSEWEEYSDIIAVIHLESGTLAFINRETKVKPITCKLVVEE